MNKRQRKKQKQNEITIFIKSSTVSTTRDYLKMKESIEYQLRKGNVIVLPPYLHVEAIIQQQGSRRIEIKQEREVKQHEV